MLKQISHFLTTNNQIVDWLLAGLITILTFWLLLRLTRMMSEKIPQRVPGSLQTRTVLKSALRINPILLVMCALYAGLTVMKLPERYIAILGQLLWVGICVQLGLWITGFIIAISLEKDVSGSTRHKSSAHGLLVAVSKFIVWIVLSLLILENLGINISALVAGLGIGGVAVALAVQSVLGDILASLSIVLDKPFEIGDSIVVGEVTGTVENIGIKTTRLRSLSGEQIILSNSALLAGRIHNYKRMYERRAILTFALDYGTPEDKLSKVPEHLRSIIAKQEKTRFERAYLKEFTAAGVIFEAVYFVLSPDINLHAKIQSSVNLNFKKILDSEGIEFAAASTTVLMRQANG